MIAGMEMPPVLIVEDEQRIAALLSEALRIEGFSSTWVGRGDQALEWLRQHEAALVLLDVVLPGRNGLDVCQQLRRDSALPIIMMSGRSDEVDRLIGLEMGADDYVCKPFSPREVATRVKTVLRRCRPAPPRQSALALDDAAFRASYNGRDLGLTVIEYQLLRQLASRRGQLFTRDQLIAGMYSDNRVVTERTVDSHIKKIRRKLEAAGPGSNPIHSVYGMGYRYD